ncbi:MAG: peptide ABC transporter substrate-binding protein, partial [Fibrobacter sp.]|nr:peptide ABC transporter substrate-binding protein [Fibrobacter sp.]
MKKRFMKPIIFFTLFVVTLFSCNKSSSSVADGTKKGILHFGNQTEPEDLDPHIVTGVPEYHILQALFEGLVSPDPVDLHPIPGAARSWDISDNHLTYTFHLRSDGRWSNGDPVKAGDFVFSFKRILSPALGAEYAYMLYCIDKAEEYHKGILKDFDKVGVKASNDT